MTLISLDYNCKCVGLVLYFLYAGRCVQYGTLAVQQAYRTGSQLYRIREHDAARCP